ncbi:pilus assembly PilX family protein [Noviherbaspirillum sp. ST9]|uniref:pilus assembly PilX family protein n=1 Tax=Noviherbaspirillum sp. ST9 TaxID=3401606 RepID=UPI003B58AAF2
MKKIHSPRQEGVVLIIALIVLVAMTLASVAMVRSVDTSTLIAGNLAYKQSGVTSGDAGINEAIKWLDGNGASLEKDVAADGYYATAQTCLDLTGNGNVDTKKCLPPFTKFNWASGTGSRTLAGKDAAGNEIAYVIHRMCTSAGALTAENCTVEESEQTGSSLGSARQMLTYQPGSWNSVANRGYYRITVRVTGARNNVSFVQAVVSR